MPRIAGRDRKQEFLDAARDLIFTEGATRFTIRRLAERVEVSEAAVYKHFPNKEALLLALLDSLFVGWELGMREIVGSAESAGKRLQQVADFHLENLLQRQFNPILLISDATDPAQAALREKLQFIAVSLSRVLRTLVQEGKTAGEFQADLDLEAATMTVLGAIQSTVLQWSLSRSKVLLKKRLGGAVSFLLHHFSADRPCTVKKSNGSRKRKSLRMSKASPKNDTLPKSKTSPKSKALPMRSTSRRRRSTP